MLYPRVEVGAGATAKQGALEIGPIVLASKTLMAIRRCFQVAVDEITGSGQVIP